MKHLLMVAILVMVLFCNNRIYAQGMAVNTTGSTADNSAMLDVGSTTKGVLVPRMTTTQRTSISSPATGLLVYDLTLSAFYYNSGTSSSPVWTTVGGMPAGTATGEMLYWNGTAWVNVGSGSNGQVLTYISGVPTWTTPPLSLSIGMAYGGGIVAYILQSGDLGYSASEQHGLIAATSDQSTGIQWYNGSFTTAGATGTAIGTGSANTTAIIANQGTGSYAAYICHTYTGGGYTDWYLPSLYELNELYINKTAICGFNTSAYYWSSSEYSGDYARQEGFGYGDTYDVFKTLPAPVRAVRAF